MRVSVRVSVGWSVGVSVKEYESEWGVKGSVGVSEN